MLSKYQATFKELTHHGSSLKRVKHVHPNPTSPNIEHYRDTKYMNIPGIQSFHDFVFACNPLTGDAECRVRERCHKGTLNMSPLKIASGHSASEVAIPQAALFYSD